MSSSGESGARTLVRGAGLMLPATLLGSALLLGVDFYANHTLSLADYGLFGAIKRVVQIGGFVVLLGMENELLRKVARAPEGEEARAAVRTALGATLLVSIVAACLLMLLAEPLAARVDPSPDTTLALRIAALALPFGAVRLLAVAACQGWGSLLPRAVVMFLAWPLLQAAGLYVGAEWLGLGAVGAVGGYAVAMGLGAAQAVAQLLRLRPNAFAPVAQAGEGSLGPMLAASWPLWVHGVGMALYTWADQVALADLAGPEEAGLYGPVATLAPLFGVGLGALNSAFAPMIAKKHADGDKVGLQAHYRLVTRWAVVLAVPPVVMSLVVPMSVLAPWSSATAEAVPALRITALTQLVCTAVGSVNYLLILSGRQRDALYNAAPAMLANVLLCGLLIPKYGITGAAIANAAAMLAANVGGLLQVWRGLGIHPFAWSLIRPLVAAPAVAIGALAAEAALGPGVLALAVGGCAGGVLFLGVLGALGLDEGDRLVVQLVREKLFRR